MRRSSSAATPRRGLSIPGNAGSAPLPLRLPTTVADTEARLMGQTLKALQRTWPEGLFYRRNVGAARTHEGRLIRFGRKGQADIAGIIDGRAIEVELKTEHVAVTVEQRNWQRAVRRAGGIAIIAMSATEAVIKIRRALDVGDNSD